jgi:hypothetical protein
MEIGTIPTSLKALLKVGMVPLVIDPSLRCEGFGGSIFAWVLVKFHTSHRKAFVLKTPIGESHFRGSGG